MNPRHYETHCPSVSDSCFFWFFLSFTMVFEALVSWIHGFLGFLWVLPWFLPFGTASDPVFWGACGDLRRNAIIVEVVLLERFGAPRAAFDFYYRQRQRKRRWQTEDEDNNDIATKQWQSRQAPYISQRSVFASTSHDFVWNCVVKMLTNTFLVLWILFSCLVFLVRRGK